MVNVNGQLGRSKASNILSESRNAVVCTQVYAHDHSGSPVPRPITSRVGCLTVQMGYLEATTQIIAGGTWRHITHITIPVATHVLQEEIKNHVDEEGSVNGAVTDKERLPCKGLAIFHERSLHRSDDDDVGQTQEHQDVPTLHARRVRINGVIIVWKHLTEFPSHSLRVVRAAGLASNDVEEFLFGDLAVTVRVHIPKDLSNIRFGQRQSKTLEATAELLRQSTRSERWTAGDPRWCADAVAIIDEFKHAMPML